MIIPPNQNPLPAEEKKGPVTPEEAKAMTPPVDLVEIINTSVAEGAVAGVVMFLRKNKLSTGDDEKAAPDHLFFEKVFAEYDTNEEVRKKYPFRSSLKYHITAAIGGGAEAFNLLYAKGEEEHIRKLCRTIAGGEVLNFLEYHIKDAIKIHTDLVKDSRQTVMHDHSDMGMGFGCYD